jgi:hypothetical protein
VEFAIVAPLIVMVLLFAIWFYELIHVRLKVQEAARYAAWEATAYPLHDYAKAPAQQNSLRTTMESGVRSETIIRYTDLDSAKTVLGGNHLLAASWTPPVVLFNAKHGRDEERVPGGAMVNLLLGIAGKLFDYASALRYQSPNLVTQSLIAAGKNKGGAMTDRLFGNTKWGFNQGGYVEATVTVALTNGWFNHGVGRFLLQGKKVSLISETHGVLADSWTLDDGQSVHSRGALASVNKNLGYFKQMDLMYLMNDNARRVLRDTWVKELRFYMDAALGFTGYIGAPPIKEEDLVRPTVASKSYTSALAGRAWITEDVLTRGYDTAPVGLTGSGGESLKEYGATLDARGDKFMGCQTEMSLGCPSSTLQQDNPLGDYLWRP